MTSTACRRSVYKSVTLEKFFTLPRDYGPAPRLAKHFAQGFTNAATSLKNGQVPTSSSSTVLVETTATATAAAKNKLKEKGKKGVFHGFFFFFFLLFDAEF